MSEPKVIAIKVVGELDELEAADFPDGVVSSTFVLFEDMDHETLTILWEQSPDLVLTHRPDWVKQHYPHVFQ